MFVFDFRARRAAKEAKDAPAQPAPEKPRVDIKKFVKIGRPGYKGKYKMLHTLYKNLKMLLQKRIINIKNNRAKNIPV